MSENLLVLVMCIFVATVTGFNPGCQYQLNQCYGRMPDIEQKVNQVEAKMNTMEGRQSAVTQAMSHEFAKLEQDTKTVKSVVNTVVEDTVKMHGDIRLLKGHGEAIVGLRRQVTSVKQATEGEISGVKSKINQVSYSLQQESEAVNKVTVMMNGQMSKNDRSLQELKARTHQLEAKIAQLEQKAGAGGSGNVKGLVDELTSRLDSLQEYYGRKIQELTDQLKEFQR